ncbi:MAG: metallophosphoesterase family protein [Campylobacterales bacterium]
MLEKLKNYFCKDKTPRLIVYGDIHGCLNELIKLRSKIDIKPNDIEVCVGDIITKGYNSIGVLDYLIQNDIKSVLGNHEDKLIRYLEHEKENKKNPIKLDSDEKNIIKNLTKEHLNYLHSLPVYLKFSNITIVHGGLQNHTVLSRLTKKSIQKVLRLRYVDENGNFVSKGQENKKCSFWADVYDGNQGFVIHGHRWMQTVHIHKNAIGIDTGCVYGNKLTAIVITNTQDYRIVQTDGC